MSSYSFKAVNFFFPIRGAPVDENDSSPAALKFPYDQGAFPRVFFLPLPAFPEREKVCGGDEKRWEKERKNVESDGREKFILISLKLTEVCRLRIK